MHEFLTFKSGKYYFNEDYDVSEINSLLVRATVLNETITDLPILPELATKIEPDIMYSSIAGTAAIEGNPITGDDVRRIAQGEDLGIYTQKHKQEIKNLIEAYHLLSGVETTDVPFIVSEQLITDIHTIITKNIPDENNIPGTYRNGVVYVGDDAHGGIHKPPKILKDIQNLMNEFVTWLNSDDVLQIEPFVRAALAHYYFCVIHPFWDGNGRTARLLEAILLQSANIKYVPRELSNYYYRNVDDYYIAFSKGIKLKKDFTPFLRFYLEAVVESLSSIKESIVSFIRKFTLRDFYRFEQQHKRITVRQLDLLNLLLDGHSSVTLKALHAEKPFSYLYNKVSTQTARRDLKKLVEQDLLQIDEENIYHLNFRALG
jgi:Fic family protein